MIIVSCHHACADILGYPPESEFPDEDRAGAEAFARRHENATSHPVTITERPAA